ncbi:MAG: ABC transporter ATP-binding protein [Hungatella sp.]|nr:ABC transporter ATP-binding protein [Hungatella sp.]
MGDALLQIEDLHTTFYTRDGLVRAVDGVSIEIEAGESVGIVGESGCGKSMTAMSLMGLLKKPGKVDGGSIVFDGQELLAMTAKDRRKLMGNRISMIFQEPMTSLNPVITVGRQVREALLLHNKGMSRSQAKERVIQMFQLVGIPDAPKRYGEYPHQLSGGLRQRVMIAMAMVCDPGLLIADEPTTALDVTIEAQILRLMKDLQEDKGTAVMMITHNLGVVAQFCTRLYVMYAGKVMESGTVREIFKHVCHPYTDGLMRSVPDMKSKERLYNIRGMVPSMLHLPKGCRFCPRCQYSMARCFEEEPQIYEASPGHFARCFLFDQGKGEKRP